MEFSGERGESAATVGFFLLSRSGESSSVLSITAAVLVAGVGTGMFVSPNNSMLMGSVPRARYGAAAAVLATSRTVGMAMGVALAGAFLSSALMDVGHDGRLAALIRSVNAGSQWRPRPRS